MNSMTRLYSSTNRPIKAKVTITVTREDGTTQKIKLKLRDLTVAFESEWIPEPSLPAIVQAGYWVPSYTITGKPVQA